MKPKSLKRRSSHAMQSRLIIEKYSGEIKNQMEKLLEQEDIAWRPEGDHGAWRWPMDLRCRGHGPWRRMDRPGGARQRRLILKAAGKDKDQFPKQNRICCFDDGA